MNKCEHEFFKENGAMVCAKCGYGSADYVDSKPTTIKAYKGFDKDLKCRGFQYEVGKEYEHKGEVKACNSGFHACESPLDVFNYYEPASSRFCEVECNGDLDKDGGDSKLSCSKISIGAEIKLPGLISAGVKFILDRVNWGDDKKSNTGDRSAATNTGDQSAATNTGYQSAATNTGDQSAATNTGDQSAATNTGDQSAATNTGDQSAATNTGYRSAATNTGDQSAATNTGYQSAATNTGDRSAATNTGDQSAASVEGKHSVACGLGVECKAKANLGSAIVLVEREWSDNNNAYVIKNIKAAKIDGENLKENVWYMLVDNEFVEVSENE
ncbi:DUF7666 domain-containing protein [Anaerosinus massiliensis]|uniref:DUF7666 domain-containing protein n=1 Tax=Massilibacillus massiliensis TaxID=1806837 RepID=UPI000B27B434|nr:hypothetical protein [Massilibacillus massiliensis]